MASEELGGLTIAGTPPGLRGAGGRRAANGLQAWRRSLLREARWASSSELDEQAEVQVCAVAASPCSTASRSPGRNCAA